MDLRKYRGRVKDSAGVHKVKDNLVSFKRGCGRVLDDLREVPGSHGEYKHYGQPRQWAIVKTTDPYHAARHAEFPKHKNEVNLGVFPTLKQANDRLFEYFCDQYERGFSNWGLAVNWCSRQHASGGAGTNKDGTRWFEWDVYKWSVVPYEKEDEGVKGAEDYDEWE